MVGGSSGVGCVGVEVWIGCRVISSAGVAAGRPEEVEEVVVVVVVVVEEEDEEEEQGACEKAAVAGSRAGVSVTGGWHGGSRAKSSTRLSVGLASSWLVLFSGV